MLAVQTDQGSPCCARSLEHASPFQTAQCVEPTSSALFCMHVGQTLHARGCADTFAGSCSFPLEGHVCDHLLPSVLQCHMIRSSCCAVPCCAGHLVKGQG